MQLSADRQPLLLNDSNLKRTAGLDRNALEMTAQELTEVSVNEDSASGPLHGRGHPDAGAGGRVCSPTHPAATAFVELKRASLRAFGHEIVVRRVCEALKPVARQCVIVFAISAVHHVRQVSSYRIGWMLSEYTNLSALKCEALAPDYLFCDHQLLTESALEALARSVALGDLRRRHRAKLALELAARGARLIETDVRSATCCARATKQK